VWVVLGVVVWVVVVLVVVLGVLVWVGEMWVREGVEGERWAQGREFPCPSSDSWATSSVNVASRYKQPRRHHRHHLKWLSVVL
jgi:hypothetical protein